MKSFSSKCEGEGGLFLPEEKEEEKRKLSCQTEGEKRKKEGEERRGTTFPGSFLSVVDGLSLSL